MRSKVWSIRRIQTIITYQALRQTTPFQSNHDRNHWNDTKYSSFKKITAIALLGSTFIHLNRKEQVEPDAPDKVYSLSEVAEHNSLQTGVWVTYQGYVFDITKFVDQHPGGKKILLAAGGSLEPFWALYDIHNNAEVKSLLQEYKIGTLKKEDIVEPSTVKSIDPFQNEPRRHPALKAASLKPYNAEPPSSLLVDSFNTPNDLFYVRNHMAVPSIDPNRFELEIISDCTCKRMTLDDLKSLPKFTINATIQCAGNRRSEMSKVKAVKGLSWGAAAIGNANWSGVRLVDVLAHYGITASSKVKHVHFEGLDAGPDGVGYAASVPVETALDPNRDVLLAYEMNGEPISRDHGAPLRVVVPGVVGARNVKWVHRITFSEHESSSHWQQNDYKGVPAAVDFDTVDFTKAPAIQELPIISAICVPEDGDVIEAIDGTVTVKGYAWSGGGRRVVRVDVSADGGENWHTAELEQESVEQPRHWSWSLWTAEIPISKFDTEVHIWAKAVDSSYNTQPESFKYIWNFRGVLSNAYHKIKVKVKQ